MKKKINKKIGGLEQSKRSIGREYGPGQQGPTSQPTLDDSSIQLTNRSREETWTKWPKWNELGTNQFDWEKKKTYNFIFLFKSKTRTKIFTHHRSVHKRKSHRSKNKKPQKSPSLASNQKIFFLQNQNWKLERTQHEMFAGLEIFKTKIGGKIREIHEAEGLDLSSRSRIKNYKIQKLWQLTN